MSGRQRDRGEHGALFETDAEGANGGRTQEPSQFDRALHELRVGDVPAGLEQRVLHGVQARMVQTQTAQATEVRREAGWGARFAGSLWSRGPVRAGRTGKTWTADWLGHGWVVGCSVTATVAVAILLVTIGVSHGSRPDLRAGASASESKGVERIRSATPAEGDALDAGQSAGARVAAQVELATATATKPLAKPAVGSKAAEGASFVMARIGGMPAPPLPLTEQERLLLRLVRAQNGEADASGREASLALLNQKTQEEELARNVAEFLKFFPPPPPAVDERESVTTKTKDEKADGASAEPAGKQSAG